MNHINFSISTYIYKTNRYCNVQPNSALNIILIICVSKEANCQNNYYIIICMGEARIKFSLQDLNLFKAWLIKFMV